jgi:hypothetical protein
MSAAACRAGTPRRRPAGTFRHPGSDIGESTGVPPPAPPPALPSSPASLDRPAQIIIGGVSATALVAAPGSRCPAASAAERPVARQDEHARADRGHSAREGPGRDR